MSIRFCLKFLKNEQAVLMPETIKERGKFQRASYPDQK